LISKGSWGKQGIRNEDFEKEIFQTENLTINEDYFKISDLIPVEVERYSYEHEGVTEINVVPIENASFSTLF